MAINNAPLYLVMGGRSQQIGEVTILKNNPPDFVTPPEPIYEVMYYTNFVIELPDIYDEEGDDITVEIIDADTLEPIDGLGYETGPIRLFGLFSLWKRGMTDAIVRFSDPSTLPEDVREYNVRIWYLVNPDRALAGNTCYFTCLHCNSTLPYECLDCIEPYFVADN